MKIKLLSIILILITLFAFNSVATGYVAGTASHSTLYADTIRGRSGVTVTVNDKLVVNNNFLEVISAPALIYGILSVGNTAVLGRNVGNNAIQGGLGLASAGVMGMHSSGNTGTLATANEGASGTNSNFNTGTLGSSTYGVWGKHSAGNKEGALGTSLYGVYTPNQMYAAGGYIAGGAAVCTDNTAVIFNGPCQLNDIAEDIYSKDELENGDVVVIDSENNEHVKKSSKPYDTLAAGIISLNPAFYIQTSNTGVPLALAGRVKAKASAENGPIKRGDLLTTSSTPGHLMRCESKEKCLGAMVGKALEPLVSGKGQIVVLVTLG